MAKMCIVIIIPLIKPTMAVPLANLMNEHRSSEDLASYVYI